MRLCSTRQVVFARLNIFLIPYLSLTFSYFYSHIKCMGWDEKKGFYLSDESNVMNILWIFFWKYTANFHLWKLENFCSIIFQLEVFVYMRILQLSYKSQNLENLFRGIPWALVKMMKLYGDERKLYSQVYI